jgi:predicted O-methyltransferase YrrM
MSKTITEMTEALYGYMQQSWLREPDVLVRLRAETAKQEMAIMQISPEQGQFMAMLVQILGAKRIIEVGTFTGYSALVMAQSMPDDSQIVCCDISEEWTSIAQRYWREAGEDHKIQLRLAPALDTLQQLLQSETGNFDFAFIDADKVNYDAYFEACLQLIRPGGVIAIDNVFWSGSVADEADQSEDTVAIRALNAKLKEDARIDLSIVPIGDGLTLARKK